MPRQIYPDYLKDYVCKCGCCRNTCCRNWTIYLTREEFDAAHSGAFPPAYSALVKTHLKINDAQDAEPRDYARISFLESGFCGFLDEDGRCKWQKVRGPENACTVCREYPRTYSQYRSDLYVSASCSCEAVNELLMGHRDKLTLLTGTGAGQDYLRCRFDEKFCAERPAAAFYPAFLRLGMGVLQNRSLSLTERMLLLSSAMLSLDCIEKAHSENEMPGYIEKFLSGHEYDRILSQTESVSIPPQAHLAFYGDMLAQFSAFKPFSDLIDQIFGGFGIRVAESKHAGRTSRQISFSEGDIFIRRKQFPFTPGLAHFYENYLVNEYMSMAVPFTDPGQSIWDNWFSFAFDWTLMRFALAGFFSETPENTELIDAVTMLTRMLTHSERVRWELLCQVKAKCGARPAPLAAFLRA